MKLLITGGAGYIGSHMVKQAQDAGHEVVVLDNFSTGHKWATKDLQVLDVDLLDEINLSKALKSHHFDGIIHFAAKSLIAESVLNPNLYYRNNVIGSLNLINEMIKNDINNLVFSSTAAIYGNPITDKIDENHPKNPINPYGRSKLIVENMLHDICLSFNFNAICFRYFNAAGAHQSGEIGESRDPETHLIPNILKSLLSNTELKVFGNDYPTHDGTCIRDYVHVVDLAQAHLLGLDYIKNAKGFSEFNLGSGTGFSVLDVINSCNNIVGKKVNYKINNKRKGDPAVLVADINKAKNSLKWKPKYTNLEDIINTAWTWHRNNF
jgi:UDP-glucose 4-epimerase